VAYIHADASPTEVLAQSILAPEAVQVKHHWEKLNVSTAPVQIRPHAVEVRRALSAVGPTPLLAGAA
jgi:hypothetical protein